MQGSCSVENLLALASVKKNSTADAISGTFQNFKDMQGITGSCNLKARSMLWRNSTTELVLDILKNVLKNLAKGSLLVVSLVSLKLVSLQRRLKEISRNF